MKFRVANSRFAPFAVAVAISAVSLPVIFDPADAKTQRFAKVTGLAQMHDFRVERGRLCMIDHTHYGTSENVATKVKAKRAAIVSWERFTDLEYGPRFASYRLSRSKKMECEKDAGGWSCSAESRPCTNR